MWRAARAYLQEYPSDYRFLVKFRNHATGISIVKRGEQFVIESEPDPESGAYDVTYITRLQYIKWSLSSQYGYEILFVGSGGIFEYASQARAKENVHRELAVMLVPHAMPPKSRFGDQPRWAYQVKRAIKGLLRKPPTDLYDLGAWTMWEGSSADKVRESR